MGTLDRSLLVQCRIALELTQEAFGDLLGCTKRSVQRYESQGAHLLPSHVQTLARAVNAVRPPLAEQGAAAAGTTRDRLGGGPNGDDPRLRAIESIVQAAAQAMGVTSDAVRPALAAAFAQAGQVGMDAKEVAEGLGARLGVNHDASGGKGT